MQIYTISEISSPSDVTSCAISLHLLDKLDVRVSVTSSNKISRLNGKCYPYDLPEAVQRWVVSLIPPRALSR